MADWFSVTVSEVGYTITTGAAMDKPGSPLDPGGPGSGREVEFLAYPGDLDKQNDADWETSLQILGGFHLCHHPCV